MKFRHAVIPIALAFVACTPNPSSERDTGAPSAEIPAVLNTATTTADAPVPMDATDSGSPAAPALLGAPTAGAEDAGTVSEPADKAVNDAIDSNLGDHEKYQAVIIALRKTVAAGDASGVAELVQYPISVEIDGKDTILKDKAEFVSRYGDFMTPEITKAIVDTRYSDLFVNYKGVMFGNGQAWINGICKDESCDTFDVKLVTLQPGP